MVKPSTPTPNHLRRLKLSLFDQSAPHILAKQWRNNYWSKMQKDVNQILPSSWKMTSQFTVMTKVLNPKSMRILLSFSIKDSRLSVWMTFFQLIYHQIYYLRVQVNVFNCGGLIIGINISHILADGFTLGSFVKEWAHISQTGTTKDSCLPSFVALSPKSAIRTSSFTAFQHRP